MENLRDKILQLLEKRGPNKTICPSEVLADQDKKNKNKMDEVRAIGLQLRNEGKILITQKGIEIKSDDWKGPIRFKLKELK